MSPLFEHYLHIIQERSESNDIITKSLLVALDNDSISFNQFMKFLAKLNSIKIDSNIKALKNIATHEVTTSEKNVKVLNLIPTQAEIDIDKSLAYAFKSGSNQIFDFLNASSPLIIKNTPIITCSNGKYIIDGHHRWSQMLLINPQADVVCLNINLDSPLKT